MCQGYGTGYFNMTTWQLNNKPRENMWACNRKHFILLFYILLFYLFTIYMNQ